MAGMGMGRSRQVSCRPRELCFMLEMRTMVGVGSGTSAYSKMYIQLPEESHCE